MKVFEYIFYRVGKFYYKKDGSSAFRALAAVSLIHIGLLAVLLMIFLKLFIPASVSSEYVKYGRIIGTVISLMILFLNYRYFKGSYWRLSDRWREQESRRQRKIRGILVVLSVFAPFILMVLLAILFNSFFPRV